MTKYTIQDANPMTYQEYGEILKVLIGKIESYASERRIKFDIVVPLLRSGGIPGSAIAIHFQITRVLPVQFKWIYAPRVILKRLLSVPKMLQEVPATPNILVCETNTGSGETAKAAIKLLKKLFPSAKLFYATVARVYGNTEKLDGVEEYFYGVQTNESFKATKEQVEKLKLRTGITIFPWENVEHELHDINSAEE